MLNKQQQKIFAIIFCYMADITLITWLYYVATGFSHYSATVAPHVDSPEFQIQLYKVILQSLTFILLLFWVAQSVVYVLAWRNFRSAYFYLKFFSVFAFALSCFIIYASSLFALVPVIIYAGGYYVFARLYKESTAKLQTLPQSPTPQ